MTPRAAQRRRPSEERTSLRVAAFGDLHWGAHLEEDFLRDLIVEAGQASDVLLLTGDLTSHGEPRQMEQFAEALAEVPVPILAVLGNHDFECGRVDEAKEILARRGVRVLDGEAVEIDGVGFAGIKGFGGGFGPHALTAFGEAESKAFVDAAVAEELKLERALAEIQCETKVVLLHYSPIPETLGEEPPQIWPFLGSSRLLRPIEASRASAVFHGHGHHGIPEATTPSAIPVYNVALPVLARAGLRFRIWDAPARASAR